MTKKSKRDKINKIEQSIEKTKKQEIIEIEEVDNKPIVEEKSEVQPEILLDIPQEIIIENNNLSDEQVAINELPKIELVNEPIKIKIDVAIKPKRTIESLGKDEFRMYQRTGRLPE
jgi:hypothetical protein